MAIVFRRCLREEWGNNGRKRVLKLFDWPVVIRQYLDLWQELKQRAAAGGIATLRETSWYRPEFFQTFSHYPTRNLDSLSRVKTHGPSEFKWYSELADVINPALIEQMMSTAMAGATIGELEQLATNNGTPMDSFRFHVMWLLKYQHLILL